MTDGRRPETMPAAYITELGGPDVIRVGELPVPVPGPEEVLVEVDVASVNPMDALIRSGRYATPTPFPFVIGRDLAGTVVAVGRRVATCRLGDRVWCNSLGHAGRQGAFSRYAVVEASRAYPLPEGVDPSVVAAVAHPAATAYLAWFVHGALRPGQTVYVGGAAGNVGRAAIRIAVTAGARVIAGARARDHGAIRICGVIGAVDFTEPDVAGAIRKIAPAGVDVYWNTSRRQDFAVAAAAVRIGGRILLTVADPGAPAPPLPMLELCTRDVSLHGFVISRASAADLAGAAALINQMLLAGTLPARVSGHLPLAKAAEAHRRIEAGEVSGRLLVHPGW